MKLLCALLLLVAGCRDLDGFLFAGDKTKAYRLPGNDIPAELIEAISFDSGGKALAGYYVRSGVEGSPAVLYNHSNDGNIDEFWGRVELLHQLGLDVLIYDYRGYGKSAGESTGEDTLHADADAAYAVFAARVPDAGKRVLYGYSLGNVPALYLAARAAAAGEALRAVIAEAPFASGEALIRGSTALPVPGEWLARGKYDNVANARTMAAPFLLLIGADDDTARYPDHGALVFAAAAEPKTLEIVPHGTHTKLPFDMGPENYKASLAKVIGP